MEGSKVVIDNVSGSRENGASGGGRPPIPNAFGSGSPYRRCLSSVDSPSSCVTSLVRHPSLVMTRSSDIAIVQTLNGEDGETEFIPQLRSGAWADIGSRSSMEDSYACADNMMNDYGQNDGDERPRAFYGVFDGHGGKHAADFVCYHLPRFIAEDEDFPLDIERVIASAFLQTDTAFAEACALDADLASGTTALAAVVIGRACSFPGRDRLRRRRVRDADSKLKKLRTKDVTSQAGLTNSVNSKSTNCHFATWYQTYAACGELM